MPPPSTTSASRAPSGRLRRARTTGWSAEAPGGESAMAAVVLDRRPCGRNRRNGREPWLPCGVHGLASTTRPIDEGQGPPDDAPRDRRRDGGAVAAGCCC